MYLQDLAYFSTGAIVIAAVNQSDINIICDIKPCFSWTLDMLIYKKPNGRDDGRLALVINSYSFIWPYFSMRYYITHTAEGHLWNHILLQSYPSYQRIHRP